MIVDDDNGERTEESKESCVWICGIMFLFRIDKKTKKKKIKWKLHKLKHFWKNLH